MGNTEGKELYFVCVCELCVCICGLGLNLNKKSRPLEKRIEGKDLWEWEKETRQEYI